MCTAGFASTYPMLPAFYRKKREGKWGEGGSLLFPPLSLSPFLPLCLGLLLLGASSPAQAQRVTAHASADTVTVGERFYLSLVAAYPDSLTASFPAPLAGAASAPGPARARPPAEGRLQFGDLEVVARRAFTEHDPEGLRTDSMVYEVAAFAVDTAFVPPIAVTFRAGADTFTVASQPLLIHVRSLVPPDAREIRDLAPLVTFPRLLWPWVLLALALLAALAAYYVWRRRRARRPQVAPPEPVPVLSPYEEAVQRMKKLEAFDLHQAENVKPYYVELSDLLRTYLARRLGVAAMESTTRELVLALRRREDDLGFPDRHVLRIRAILELADLAKFADLRPSAERGREALRETQAVVEATEAALRPPPEEAAPRPASQPAQQASTVERV